MSFKELATELGPIFAHLFQQSIDYVEIPKEWTLANFSDISYTQIFDDAIVEGKMGI